MTSRGAEPGIGELLGQAEGFEQAGDYLEARARARLARAQLVACTARSTRARVARALERYESLAERWQAQNAARAAAHEARELQAIGPKEPQAAVGETGWRRAVRWLDGLRKRAGGGS